MCRGRENIRVTANFRPSLLVKITQNTLNSIDFHHRNLQCYSFGPKLSQALRGCSLLLWSLGSLI